MTKDLKFSKETYYIGRNGQGRQTGIGFTKNADCLQIEPINSKGNLANCVMNIPFADIPAMIERMQEVLRIEKDVKIDRIRYIISSWGETTSTELNLQSSPCISSIGEGKKNHSQLIEGYKLDGVDVALYNNDLLLRETYIPYGNLPFDILNQVLEIMEKYYADCFVETMKH